MSPVARHFNSYASASEKTRPRVRRARAQEGAAVSSLAGSSFPFLSLSLFLYLLLPPLLAFDGAGRGSLLLCALHPSTERNRLLSCARVRTRTRDCVCRNDRERERERGGGEERGREGEPGTPPHHAGLHARGESIDVRCILPLLVPPHRAFSAATAHPSATDSDLRTRARRRAVFCEPGDDSGGSSG